MKSVASQSVHVGHTSSFLTAFLTLALLVVSGGVAAQADAEKFLAAIEVQGEQQQAMSAAARLYQSCVYCHGEQGRASSSFYPRLAGQPAAYLAQQLKAYGNNVRENVIMSSLAKILSDSEVAQLSDYLAAQEPRPADTAMQSSSASTKGSSRAAALGCAACHGKNYEGQANYARLAGQGYDYLSKQLDDYRAGRRTDPGGIMSGLATALSDEDIENMSRYFSGL